MDQGVRHSLREEHQKSASNGSDGLYSMGGKLRFPCCTSRHVYIGNLVAAQTLSILRERNIKRVVNCQDPNTENFHEREPGFEYRRFPISHWWREKNMKIGYHDGGRLNIIAPPRYDSR